MRLFLIALAFLTGPAHANSIDAIAAECERQMLLGTCSALNDPGSYTPEQLARPMLLVGITDVATGRPASRVPFSAYLAVRGSGDIRMCQVAREACSSNWQSDRCKVSRALWGNGK